MFNGIKGNISEIFSSIQGEGIYAGQPQTFLRLAGCNLSCAYCDTGYARKVAPTFRYEKVPGCKDFVTEPNPVSSERLLQIVMPFLSKTKWISFTGGEPLLQDSFLKEFIPLVKAQGAKIYLETNGTLFNQLSELTDWIDVVAMDIKLTSTSGLSFDDEIWTKFLSMSATNVKKTFVKVVVGNDSSDEELSRVTEIIRNVNESIALVLQPVTSTRDVHAASDPRLEHLKTLAQTHLQSVHIVPQTHKMLGVL